jgi:hypothetical protein
VQKGTKMNMNFDGPRVGITSEPLGASKKSGNPAAADRSEFEQVLKGVITAIPAWQAAGRLTSAAEFRVHLMAGVRADRDQAVRMLNLYTFNSLGGPLLDMTDPDNIRYSGTGERVTPESSEYFAKVSYLAQRQLASLYQSETAKGAEPADILEKVYDFHEALPERFLGMLAW